LSTKELQEVIVAFGHKNILAIHPSTLMFTKENLLKTTGDCIVGINADKGLMDFSENFKEMLKKKTSTLTINLQAAGLIEKIHAYGSPKLVLTHPTDLVIRKSDFISDRTMAIHADKSSNDLSRQLVERLKDPKQKIVITISVRC
jgi:uncharacterized protein